MSKIEVNEIDAQSGSTITVGSACKSVAVPGNVVKTNAVQASDGGNIVSQCGTTNTIGASGDTNNIPGAAVVTGNITGAEITSSSNVIKSNAYQASDGGNIVSQSGTNITIGASGDTISLASGASQSGFGRSGSVNWQTGSIKTSDFTAANGEGYFINTTSGAVVMTLPSGTAGDIVALADYANTFDSNKVTVTPNGSDNIGGNNGSTDLTTKGLGLTLVFVDSTQGWVDVGDNTQDVIGGSFITATGGTITTVCTNFKVHTFTGPGTFCVTAGAGALSVADYLVIAGGGAGGSHVGAGGAGGGYRESSGTSSGCYSVSPLGSGVSALPISVQAYPITVGGGGSKSTNNRGGNGSNSIFSTITSTAGGGGGGSFPGGTNGRDGGSGGGAGKSGGGTGGSGNTPPVSPPQGNNGGPSGPGYKTGGGGGATAAGTAGGNPGPAGPGGAGGNSSINGTPVPRAGGGGGSSVGPDSGNGGSGGGTPGSSSSASNASDNTGGGGGGAHPSGPNVAGNGGSGIVIIRYKFQ